VSAPQHPPAATSPAAGGRSWTVELPAGLTLLNANQRLHWRPKAERTRTIRAASYACVKGAKVPKLKRAAIVVAAIVVEYRPPDRRRRDVHNLYPSAKAAIDGLVDAGVLPDDSDRYLVGPDMRAGEVAPLERLVLHITELEVSRGDR
jgi:crossover junction endodeoxyribonuclease RusA